VRPDLVLFDESFNPVDVRNFVAAAELCSVDVAVVVVCHEEIDEQLSDKFRQSGALGCISAEADAKQLKEVLSLSEDGCKTTGTDNAEYFLEDFAASVLMVGKSKAMRHTQKMLNLVAKSNCNPVLIVGETGTGKEIAAKAIHHIRHPKENFVAINCAALTANLLESELFGHAKGSFTSADKEKTGLLEVAGQGTVFLDEISETPLDLQAKLLRVLQEKTFRKVGGLSDIQCKATIIASSNRDLRKEVEANRFRRDLYYRLNICPVTIAPLKTPERSDDIRLLANYFLKTSTVSPEKASLIKGMTEVAIESLQRHDWPGNVHELKNVIDRAILLEVTDKIGLSSIIIDPTDINCSNSTTGNIKDFSLDKAECQLIGRALQETGWQKTRAAALLGITRATLYAKVKQHNLKQDLNIPIGESNSSGNKKKTPVTAA